MYSIKFKKENYRMLKKALKFLGVNLFKRNDCFFYKEHKLKYSYPVLEGQEIKLCFDNPFNRDLFEITMQQHGLDYDCLVFLGMKKKGWEIKNSIKLVINN